MTPPLSTDQIRRYQTAPERERPRRAVIILPNGFTLASLFFGIFAIVAASRSEFDTAGLYVVFGGLCDALDGRVARATGTGSRFGSELDSLVDAITFGLAPAMIMYFAVLNRNGWDWIFSFIFCACAVIRLARFNVEQAGRAKKYFHGLPSPAAGMTLATYYWFSQTPLYNQTVLGDLNWTTGLRGIMLVLAFLMISNVSYPAVPTVGFRKISEILGTLAVIATFIGVLFLRKEFYFPALICYVLYGLAKTVLFGLIDRRPKGDSPVIDDEEPLLLTAAGVVEPIGDSPRRHRRRRRRRGPGPGDSQRGGGFPPTGPTGGPT
ncbi:MAG TPA: CDP-diacylglycerol--serine O-phosphatidyltransferase [Gemmatimonadaceae bacterium]|nr:CDP-diacylglycerol--serine O-phosphatidyltransferase [Gemmatimonadaceae bacterium]